MKDYTVILMYPDYCAENYGEDTYQTYVSANSVAEAQEAAQREAAEGYFGSDGLDAQSVQEDIDANYEDWRVVAVLEGSHADIKEVD